MPTFSRLPTHILRDKCLKYAIKGKKPGRFLEMGPGAGRTTRIFLDRGFTGVGYDISEESRKILRENMKEYDRRLEIPDTLSNVAPESMDYLFSFDVLEDIEDDLGALRDWTRYLKQGGMLLIGIPAHMSIFGKSDELMGHFRRYEKAEVRALLENAGYSDIRILNYGFPLVNITLASINFIYRFTEDEKKDYRETSLDERTKKSGIKSPDVVNRLSVVFNDVTVYPFILLQRMFFFSDVGVAYVASGIKK